MDKKSYYSQKVEVVLKRDSKLFERIEAAAALHGVSVAVVVDSLVSRGAEKLLEERLPMLEDRK